MDVLTFLNLIVAMATVAAAVFAFVQAKTAVESREDAVRARNDAEQSRRRAESAQMESTRIAGEARDALARSADALEKSNEIAAALLPKDEVKWAIVSTGTTGRFRITNAGTIAATGVVISGEQGVLVDDEGSADELTPGDSLEFASWRGRGMPTPKLTVQWSDARSPARRTARIAVRD